MSPASPEYPAAGLPGNPAELEERLTNYDERLRLGLPLDFAGESTVVDPSGREIKPLYECLDLLEAAWPRRWRFDRGELPKQIGRFQLQGVLGIGGFGIVYKAYDPRLRRPVALKVPRLHSLASSRLRARFQREARAAASLDHPNIVPIHEVGEEGAACYIVAAYCDGPNLAEWLHAQTGPVPVRVAAELACRLASAVQYSHAHGVLHRDLKPSNVLLVKEDHDSSSVGLPFVPRVSDFGLAKLLEEDTSESMSMALGTPAYMSPEQAGVGSSPIGPLADVYGLGAILYDVLCRRPPFPCATIPELFEQLRTGEPVPPRRLRPEIPRDLEAICLKCLEKEPAARYASAGDLADDLQRFLRGEPTKARPQRPARKIWRAISRPKVRSRVVVSSLLLMVAALSVTARQFHQASVASRLKEEARQRELFIPPGERYRQDVARADSLLHDPVLTGADRIQAAQQARNILKTHLPRAGEPDQRGFEWHYLWQTLQPAALTPRLSKLHEIRAHQGDAYFVTFSPDGARLATCGKDGLAQVWETATGRRLATLQGHTGEINCVDFSPDGGTLATASDDQTVRLWDAESGEFKQVLWPHTAPVVGAAFNPVSSHIAAVAQDGAIRVWDLSGLTEIFSTIGHRGTRIEALAWSPEGRLLATVNVGTGAQLWDASKSYAPYEVLPSVAAGGETICFSRDGRSVAMAYGAQVCVRRVATGDQLARNAVVSDWAKGFRSARFLEDDRTLVVAGHQSSAGFVDWMTGTHWSPWETSADSWSAAVSPDGKRIALTDVQGTLTIWDSSERRPVDRTEIDVFVPSDELPQIDLSPDGTRIVVSRPRDTASDHGGIAFWDVASPQPKFLHYGRFSLWPGESFDIEDLAFSPDSREVAVGVVQGPRGGRQLVFFDAATGAMVRHARGNYLEILPYRRAIYSPDGSNLVTLHAIGGELGCDMRFWTPSTGQLRRSASTGTDHPTRIPVLSGAFSPDGEVFATACMSPQNQLEFFRVSDLNKIATWDELIAPVNGHAFTPDGRRVVIDFAGGLCSMFDRETRETIWTFTAEVSTRPGLAISPDGRTLALGREDAVILVQADTGKLLLPLRFPKPILGLHDLTFSADGRVLATLVKFIDNTWKVCLWRIDVE